MTLHKSILNYFLDSFNFYSLSFHYEKNSFENSLTPYIFFGELFRTQKPHKI